MAVYGHGGAGSEHVEPAPLGVVCRQLSCVVFKSIFETDFQQELRAVDAACHALFNYDAFERLYCAVFRGRSSPQCEHGAVKR